MHCDRNGTRLLFVLISNFNAHYERVMRLMLFFFAVCVCRSHRTKLNPFFMFTQNSRSLQGSQCSVRLSKYWLDIGWQYLLRRHECRDYRWLQWICQLFPCNLINADRLRISNQRWLIIAWRSCEFNRNRFHRRWAVESLIKLIWIENMWKCMFWLRFMHLVAAAVLLVLFVRT